ncbi:glutathione peroxidase [Chromobacterium sphagni]|uniref:Glutathione peroxidase n=1 Tax=Chromobacterium sphagni TaxID=1903179 RepID=A0A1S1X3K6_9NEIS|nr:glutathione peroxidase [Chromobacterium sphagni]OHX14059.1 glutathione peroxidase [Chromobacterium sphagni]OHX20268.1 glutathione peroxidase [Chromobacterium sphagni]
MRILSVALVLASQMAAAACPALLDYKVPGLMGGEINLCQYADRPVLVVNTASHCGFTPQFTQLESLYKQYGPRGLVVVGFPSNDFFQELDKPAEIGQFCQANYGVTFPMASKGHVRGSDAQPFFKALIAATDDAPSWNFHKYLILPGASKVVSIATRTKPDASEVVDAFLPYLQPPAAAAQP